MTRPRQLLSSVVPPAPVAIAAASAVALVIVLSATTSLFESGPPTGAYEAGFEDGFTQAATLDQEAITRLESVWFARGVETGRRPPPSQTEVQAVRLVALYVVTTAVSANAADRETDYDAGYAEGRDDARAGTPPRFTESPPD